jgi:hypothetical protein
MFADEDPFWFVSSELLTRVWHAEFNVLTQLLEKHPDFRNLLDAPEATVPERAACFALLAHRKLVEMIDEKFVARYEESPSLDDVESSTLKHTYDLVSADAPSWVLELNQVVERLPAHIFNSLPKPLRMGGYNPDNPEQMQAIQSAKEPFSNVEQIQTLTGQVLDQQLRRLEGRWSAARPVTNVIREISVRDPESKKKKARRTRDKLRIARDKVIAEIDDIAPTPVEFVKLMDERKVQPQPTWSGWPGSWSQAYKDPRLRKLIHQDKSRALERVRRERKR